MWINNPTGGLFYHLKALRFRKSLWKGFHSQLNNIQHQWLPSIPQDQRKFLVLVGGSGGYAQSAEFLKHFETIIHIDIDPWASFFFQRNHPHLTTRFYRESIFDENNKIKSQFLTEFEPSNSTWMWCNLLGQIGLIQSEEESLLLFKNIQSQMASYPWMSFHDLYSFSSRKKIDTSKWPTSFKSSQEVQNAIQSLPIKKVALSDHLTNHQFEFDQRTTVLWPLTPRQHHFVEIGFSGASSEED